MKKTGSKDLKEKESENERMEDRQTEWFGEKLIWGKKED